MVCDSHELQAPPTVVPPRDRAKLRYVVTGVEGARDVYH